MVGIPRSRGCQQCKARKIKCDENWPTCSGCVRSGRPCSGPSTLVKFVVNNNHVVDAPPSQPSSSRKKQQQRRAEGTPQPSPPPTTAADLVAARLVHHLEGPGEEQLVTRTGILALVPRRVAASESLRDAADLLCDVWTASLTPTRAGSSRSTTRAAGICGLPAYGRALGSLSRALVGDRAFAVETLASVVILQRAEDLLDPGSQHTVHVRGVATLLQRLAGPDPDDHFQSCAYTETYGIMLPYMLQTGWNAVYDDPQWRETIARGQAASTGVPALAPQFGAIMAQYRRISRTSAVLFDTYERLLAEGPDRAAASCPLPVTDMAQAYEEAEQSLACAHAALLRRAAEVGALCEEACRTPVTATACRFATTKLCLSVVSGLSFHLFLLHMRCRWSAAFALPDADSLAVSFREACFASWRLVPALRCSGAALQFHLGAIVALSLEVADQEQRDYLHAVIGVPYHEVGRDIYKGGVAGGGDAEGELECYCQG